ncbi:hypothetical protein LV92_01572 [Arenibacter echinorum]|uniref:Uncharacterized protein n=1 Tax=Arenibacter echinorum TaxID=440515 RepID=A0A327R678_9FLAO|nr:hypothetical protein LV92_01572 [Arenibacter echinorum]
MYQSPKATNKEVMIFVPNSPVQLHNAVENGFIIRPRKSAPPTLANI